MGRHPVRWGRPRRQATRDPGGGVSTQAATSAEPVPSDGGAAGAHSSGSSAAAATSGRRPLAGRRLSLVLLALVLAGVVAQFVTVPYVLLRPGPAVDILGAPEQGAPVVTVEGAKTYPTSGSLYFTTVAQYGGPGHRPSAWEALSAAIDPASDVVGESVVFPPQVSQQQVEKENTAAMADSQQTAVAVALRELGTPVTEKAVVAEVVQGSPATGVVKKGDVIAGVNGHAIKRAPQVAEFVRSSTGPVTLTLGRGSGTTTATITPAEREGHRVVGVLIQPTFSFGVNVAIHAGDVGGPSAGTMFALGVYDTLTPGALTGGQKIAGTGTLDSTGAVGPIGGIAQKMEGAHEEGAPFFLAPRDNCADVVDNVPHGLTVTPVATFDEARHAVAEIAAGRGAQLPHCPGA